MYFEKNYFVQVKRIITYLPESYLIAILLAGAYTPPFSWNPILLVLALFVLSQAIFQYKITGLVLGFLFVFGNVLFLGAVLSEFNEFTVVNASSQELLWVGLGIFTLNFIMSLGLLYKYWNFDFTRKISRV